MHPTFATTPTDTGQPQAARVTPDQRNRATFTGSRSVSFPKCQFGHGHCSSAAPDTFTATAHGAPLTENCPEPTSLPATMWAIRPTMHGAVVTVKVASMQSALRQDYQCYRRFPQLCHLSVPCLVAPTRPHRANDAARLPNISHLSRFCRHVTGHRTCRPREITHAFFFTCHLAW